MSDGWQEQHSKVHNHLDTYFERIENEIKEVKVDIRIIASEIQQWRGVAEKRLAKLEAESNRRMGASTMLRTIATVVYAALALLAGWLGSFLNGGKK
ncbi:MAG: hypothetical protein N2234_00235 [Planctomycetota bacterium]|nr:hypothetical protein [Planctomycetota bacterium]